MIIRILKPLLPWPVTIFTLINQRWLSGFTGDLFSAEYITVSCGIIWVYVVSMQASMIWLSLVLIKLFLCLMTLMLLMFGTI